MCVYIYPPRTRCFSRESIRNISVIPPHQRGESSNIFGIKTARIYIRIHTYIHIRRRRRGGDVIFMADARGQLWNVKMGGKKIYIYTYICGFCQGTLYCAARANKRGRVFCSHRDKPSAFSSPPPPSPGWQCANELYGTTVRPRTAHTQSSPHWFNR